MRVRTQEQVVRRAMIVRRFLRSVPRRQCIEVSLIWLGWYGCLMAVVGVAVSLPLVMGFAEWAVTRPH